MFICEHGIRHAYFRLLWAVILSSSTSLFFIIVLVYPGSLVEKIVTPYTNTWGRGGGLLLLSTHGNDNQINGVTRHLGFLDFQVLFKFECLYFKMTRKQHLVIQIHKIVGNHCEIVSI